jgi:hypothetical protein
MFMAAFLDLALISIALIVFCAHVSTGGRGAQSPAAQDVHALVDCPALTGAPIGCGRH